MKYISEKVAYIKGLAKGLKLDTSSDEGKIITALIDVIDDLTDAVDGIAEAHDDLADYVEVIDEDLEELSDEFDDLNDLLLDFPDYDFPNEDDEDDDLYEVICPDCGEVYLTDFESFDADDVICPKCGKKFELESTVVNKLKQAEACMHHNQNEEA